MYNFLAQFRFCFITTNIVHMYNDGKLVFTRCLFLQLYDAIVIAHCVT